MIVAIIAGCISIVAWAAAAYMAGIHRCANHPNPYLHSGRVIEEASVVIELRRSPLLFYSPMALDMKILDPDIPCKNRQTRCSDDDKIEYEIYGEITSATPLYNQISSVHAEIIPVLFPNMERPLIG